MLRRRLPPPSAAWPASTQRSVCDLCDVQSPDPTSRFTHLSPFPAQSQATSDFSEASQVPWLSRPQQQVMSPSQQQVNATFSLRFGKVDVRLPRKRNSNSHGARPVLQSISTIKWIRTSSLSINKSLSQRSAAPSPTTTRCLLSLSWFRVQGLGLRVQGAGCRA